MEQPQPGFLLNACKLTPLYTLGFLRFTKKDKSYFFNFL